MFQLTLPVEIRKLMLVIIASALLLCAGAGGAAWYFTRCNMLDYLKLAAASPSNRREQYLFACGYVWRSGDGGHTWVRQSAHGLPFGVRDGYIAIDRQPGFLYLGVLINTSSSIYCLQCAWTKLRPAVYTSMDSGKTWSYAYKFKRGPAEDGGFLLLIADPDRDGAAWAVIKNGDEIAYYATGTSGQFWRRTCREYSFTGSGGCELPGNVLQQFNELRHGSQTGQ